ncbi:hypothetical protein BGZ95_005254, partial [Linnemannia exigua]
MSMLPPTAELCSEVLSLFRECHPSPAIRVPQDYASLAVTSSTSTRWSKMFSWENGQSTTDTVELQPGQACQMRIAAYDLECDVRTYKDLTSGEKRLRLAIESATDEEKRHQYLFNYYAATMTASLSDYAYESNLRARIADLAQDMNGRLPTDLEIDVNDMLRLLIENAQTYKRFAKDTSVILAFKGTDCYEEWVSNLKMFRHSDDNETCSNQCAPSCDNHTKYLDGGVHQGFYDALFKSLPGNDHKDHKYLTAGPANAMTIIMEKILYDALDRNSHLPMHLWITGHSRGGAFASLFMARLQTIVDEKDPLVRELEPDDQRRFIGFTVLTVMNSQAIKNFPAAYACQSCVDERCRSNEWRTCSECPYCKTLRSRVRARIYLRNKCHERGDTWALDCARDKRLCTGCKDFMDSRPDAAGCECPESRFCGECGNDGCAGCDMAKESQLCKMEKRDWPLVLRDCYTYGSPKVGDTKFAETFDKNQR